MMGSGKSTIGRILAEATGWPLHDNDALLEAVTGMTARDLLATRGEDALRDGEERALLAGLAMPPPAIVDAAAGTIESARVRGLLLEQFVVWLRASPGTLFERSAGAAHRPWLDRGRDWFVMTDTERAPLYEAVADLVVDTELGQPHQVAQEILDSIRA
jgi:shikimate kinase